MIIISLENPTQYIFPSVSAEVDNWAQLALDDYRSNNGPSCVIVPQHYHADILQAIKGCLRETKRSPLDNGKTYIKKDGLYFWTCSAEYVLISTCQA